MIKILKKGEYVLDDVLIRDRSGRDVSQVVSEIVFGVKMGGDPTLKNYTKTLDGADIKDLELMKEEIDAAVAEVPAEVMETLQEAADRIAFYQKAQLKEGYVLEEDGVTCNYTPAIGSMGGSQQNSEEEYLILKLMRSIGIVAIDNQARV